MVTIVLIYVLSGTTEISTIVYMVTIVLIYVLSGTTEISTIVDISVVPDRT